MTSTYDHRVIQGAESGRFLQVVEAYLQGEHGFYDGVFASLGAELGPPPAPPAPAAAAAAARDAAPAAPRDGAAIDEQMLQAVQAATSLLKAHRTHGHLAARLDPLGTEPEGDPALEPDDRRPHAGDHGQDPGQDPAHVRAGRDAGRRAAAPARDLLRHDRLRDRAHRQPPPAHVAAREDRGLGVPQAADQRRAARAAAAPGRGRRARALHAQGLPGPEAVLDRGPRHDGPDARRDRSSSPPRTARARSSSAWPTAAGSTCSPTTSAARTRRSSPSSRAPRRSRP